MQACSTVEAGSRCVPPPSSPMVPYLGGGGPTTAAAGRHRQRSARSRQRSAGSRRAPIPSSPTVPDLGGGGPVAVAAGRQRRKSARSSHAPPPSSPTVLDPGSGGRGRRQRRLPRFRDPRRLRGAAPKMQRGGRPALPRSSNRCGGGRCGHDNGGFDWARWRARLGLLGVFYFFLKRLMEAGSLMRPPPLIDQPRCVKQPPPKRLD
jgi:hypothetical protein